MGSLARRRPQTSLGLDRCRRLLLPQKFVHRGRSRFGEERGEFVLAAEGHGGADQILNRRPALGLEPPPGSIRNSGPRGGIDLRIVHRQTAASDPLTDNDGAFDTSIKCPHTDDSRPEAGSTVQIRSYVAASAYGVANVTLISSSGVDAQPRRCESESKEPFQ